MNEISHERKAHTSVSSTSAACPAELRHSHRCVVCCKKCNKPDGALKVRDAYHTRVKPGCTPAPGLGRYGYPATTLCVTCGFIPLCTTVRFHMPGALTCWDAFHTEKNLMTGPKSETCCHLKNPWDELGLVSPGQSASSSTTPAPRNNVANLGPQARGGGQRASEQEAPKCIRRYSESPGDEQLVQLLRSNVNCTLIVFVHYHLAL
jgi:hypothetical protein